MTFGSLFSGIGGLDLGLERAGMTCCWQSEINPYASRVLAKHWPEVPNYGDITKIDWSTVSHVDLVCGGFPCQPHSLAGARKGSADERDLWPEVVRCLREVEPQWFLGENVPGLLSSDDGRMFAGILGDLAALGYDATWCSLRASDFGAPHRRERVFLLAYSGSERRGECLHRAISETQKSSAGWGNNQFEFDCRKLADTMCSGCHQSQVHSGRQAWEDAGARSAELADPMRSGAGAGPPPSAVDERTERTGWRVSAESGHGSEGMADTNPRGWGIERGAAGSAGHADECGEAVEHACVNGGRPGLPQSGEGQRRRGSSDAGCDVADPGNGQFPQQGRGAQGRNGAGSAGADVPDTERAGCGQVEYPWTGAREAGEFEWVLPPFPPSPNDAAGWRNALDNWPWLAPALSEAEVESLLRRMANGFPHPLDSRTGRLKALGNAVVPIEGYFLGCAILAAERELMACQ